MKNVNNFSLIKRHWSSEKSTSLNDSDCYMFEVSKSSSKPQIKKAFENFFDVKVLSIKTSIRRKKYKAMRNKRGKTYRPTCSINKKPHSKKIAFVTLCKGHQIDIQNI